jgi:hypothetical protein
LKPLDAQVPRLARKQTVGGTGASPSGGGVHPDISDHPFLDRSFRKEFHKGRLAQGMLRMCHGVVRRCIRGGDDHSIWFEVNYPEDNYSEELDEEEMTRLMEQEDARAVAATAADEEEVEVRVAAADDEEEDAQVAAAAADDEEVEVRVAAADEEEVEVRVAAVYDEEENARAAVADEEEVEVRVAAGLLEAYLARTAPSAPTDTAGAHPTMRGVRVCLTGYQAWPKP